MFTGIVEEVGSLEKLTLGGGFGVIEIRANKVLENTKIGDSIASNGVCLTVLDMTKSSFKANVMGETLEKSSLGNLKSGNKINLERAMNLEDRFGGHIVSGHIDGVGKITDIEKKIDGTWFTISASKEILKYIIYKGSIAIDGISLTVAYVDDGKFKVSVIPHTLENTILYEKKVQSVINLECDVVGKYIEKLVNNKDKEIKNESNVTMEFLRENGF
ncbi:riboflavin synthase [Clostridium botulinum]|uniref:Riboflavin synthase n=1 Tax=Clostridium botulinum TaxID=1491 RepID=A0A6B4JKS1_CLOBO|nr:riboflavin synthase [Clostridium botulinum]EES50639.1 riboflavin synthase, alpha subunit [Clostridium botulinum E1 str. 'BoNT E Beluga']MBY6760850.1 riboflavin synthase [Clostridium botulinum]MBY6919858.1 riboflavin synthase [Clostridium botulinum]MCR1130637.1 riboflavin synthase [Clostridium botulinum]NFJ57539.1 riboflavin synthase [Clostridium botulinum]